MFLRHYALALPILLAACATAPVSSSDTKSANAALTQLRVISQSAELGAYTRPSSFPVAAPYYVDALNGFRKAMPAEEGSGLGDRTEERDGIRTAVGNCIEAIELTADLHRTSGLTRNPDDFLALTVCESAARTMGRSR